MNDKAKAALVEAVEYVINDELMDDEVEHLVAVLEEKGFMVCER